MSLVARLLRFGMMTKSREKTGSIVVVVVVVVVVVDIDATGFCVQSRALWFVIRTLGADAARTRPYALGNNRANALSAESGVEVEMEAQRPCWRSIDS